MNDDTLLNKIEIMERCVARIHEEYDNKSDNLYLNITRQDSIILNLERACHAAIDAAMRVLRLKKLGLPKQSREAFFSLGREGLINTESAEKLARMVGFRNIAVHDYQNLNLGIVEQIINHELEVFRDFKKALFQIQLEDQI